MGGGGRSSESSDIFEYSITITAGLLGDLFVLDSLSLMWTELSGLASGPAPAQRCGHGFATVDRKLYVFGGQGGESESCY